MNDIEDITLGSDEKLNENINEFIRENDMNQDWAKLQQIFMKKYKKILRKKDIRKILKDSKENNISRTFVKKAMRSEHGVFVVSVVTSPYPKFKDENGIEKTQMFSCRHNCSYCPQKEDYPRSYLPGEPGVDRAYSVGYDTVKQIHIRLDSYRGMGQDPDKLEIIVLGGTLSEYPQLYVDEVVRDIYFAANTWKRKQRDERLTLEEEIYENHHNSEIHVIGLTLETRPDSINIEEIKRFRKYNCTRVQIGIQHTDNEILKGVKRGHSIERSMRAIKLLFDNGYKVDVHLMPNLPNSTVEKDREMFNKMLYDPRLRADQWKVYPTSIVPYSDLEKMFKEGKYKPYGDDELMELLIEMKSKIHKWIRLNRIVRDIPVHFIQGGCQTAHMRQLLHNEMKKRNLTCNCIRCRSVKNRAIENNFQLSVQHYDSCDGLEYFVSVVSEDDKVLYGFLRLRIPSGTSVILEEIKDCALIRELHVYGVVQNVGSSSCQQTHKTQHRGFGKLLMKEAERIAFEKHNFKKIAVISGVGVRKYYEKLGYELKETFMVKTIM